MGVHIVLVESLQYATTRRSYRNKKKRSYSYKVNFVELKSNIRDIVNQNNDRSLDIGQRQLKIKFYLQVEQKVGQLYFQFLYYPPRNW